jgi:hypothetical protein
LRSALVALVALAGCQPMYGAPAEQLHHHSAGNRGLGEKTIAWVDACEVDFSQPAAAAHPTPRAARLASVRGEASVQRAKVARTDETRNEQWVAAVGAFREALVADPYDAEATVQLARAYDAVNHRGCALAMLRRLAKLTINPTLSPEAHRQVELVADNDTWFARYRKDALAAIGRSTVR